MAATHIAPLPAADEVEEAVIRARVRMRLFDEREPARMGRFVLHKQLGTGAMGTVFAAYDEELRRMVALKLVREDDGIERLLREAQLAAPLYHPHIVRVFECGRQGDGSIYTVMELIEGPSLATMMADTGRIPWPVAQEMVVQIADALAYAHRCNVVHRDVTPSNILVTQSGGAPHCKIVDFGLARSTAIEAAGQKLTGSGTVLGTPRYMSPEQARARPTDGRSDMYALGCILYEMLTGRHAARGTTVGQVLMHHLGAHPQRFAEVAPDLHVPAGVEAIVRRATRKDPALRFADIAQMRDALAAVGSGTPPVRVPPEALDDD
jgi:serine/threonine-protein kinase